MDDSDTETTVSLPDIDAEVDDWCDMHRLIRHDLKDQFLEDVILDLADPAALEKLINKPPVACCLATLHHPGKEHSCREMAAWGKIFERELSDLYEKYVPPSLGLSFGQWVRVAYFASSSSKGARCCPPS